MEPPGTTLIAAAIAIAIGAMFSALDAGLLALGEVRLRAISDEGGRHAATADRALSNYGRIRARLRTWRVLSLTVAAALAAQVAAPLGGLPGALGAAAIVGLVYSVIVEVGGTLAAHRSGTWTLAVLRYLRPFELLMLPLSLPVHIIGEFIERSLDPSPDPNMDRITEIGLEQVIARGEEAGALGEEHAELIRSVFEFKNTVAHQVMIPRTQMISFEASQTVAAVASIIEAEGHSRYPVYEERIDQVVGIFYAKDLFARLGKGEGGDLTVGELVRTPVFFASETQKIGTLLSEMQRRRVHLSVVVDEFGGVSGLVTLEDILEEIVGEIEDEHDEDEQPVEELEPGRYLVDAGLSIYDLEAQVGIELLGPDGDYDSVGGMMIDLVGHVPSVGESVRAGRHQLTVRDGDQKHIRRIEIEVMGPVAAE